MTTLNNQSLTTINITLAEVRERVLHVVGQGNADAYQLGWLYNYVVDRELAQQGGFKDAADFFKKEVKVLGQSTLTTYGSVARAFTATACVKYGAHNLYALLTYEKVAVLTVDGDEPGPTPIQVPQEDGSVVQKPFAECTVEELKRAIKHKRTPPKPLPEEATSRVETYRNVLDQHLSGRHSIQVSARLERGKVLISFKDVPEEQMATVIEALMESLSPVRAVA
ncbi:MAG TPA: hypothetical protein VK539_07695 [Myxococcaceae bacterium]|nr:hypothetical protein [Myxococcaceae bacterium]